MTDIHKALQRLIEASDRWCNAESSVGSSDAQRKFRADVWLEWRMATHAARAALTDDNEHA